MLDTEYTTDQFVQAVLAAMPAYGDWYDSYANTWYNFNYAWSDPAIDATQGARGLSADEAGLVIVQTQYRFTLRNSAPGTMLTWLEVFIPDADVNKPEVVDCHSISASAGQTDSYTIDVTKPANIDDPTRGGRYTVCVPIVDLDVNDSNDLTDDYVVLQKRSGTLTDGGPPCRPTSKHGTNSAPSDEFYGIAGNSDNSVPLRVTFNAVYGLAANVTVTARTTGGGTVNLVQADNNQPLPTGGIRLVSGTDADSVELLIQGTHSSSALGDVIIEATTDVTNGAVIGRSEVTVLWIDQSFRGSDAPGPWAPENEAATSSTIDPQSPLGYLQRVVGGAILYTPSTTPDGTYSIFNQMEIKGTVSPQTAVVPDVTWRCMQEVTGVYYPPCLAYHYADPIVDTGYRGNYAWDYDGLGSPLQPDITTRQGYVHGLNADYLQEIDAPYLYAIDTTGWNRLPVGYSQDTLLEAGYVVKFRTWWEVYINGKWYVCSTYLWWDSILHLQTQNGSVWGLNLEKRNEIRAGWLPTLSGFSESQPFIENP